MKHGITRTVNRIGEEQGRRITHIFGAGERYRSP